MHVLPVKSPQPDEADHPLVPLRVNLKADRGRLDDNLKDSVARTGHVICYVSFLFGVSGTAT